MAGSGLRPVAKAQRIDVIRRTQAASLAPGVAELLLRKASVISEGAIRNGIGGREIYFGSTMLTIDLATLAEELRVPADETLAQELAPLLARSAHLKLHALRIARSEAERKIPDRSSDRFSAETKVRAIGARIEVDVDVEMSLAAALTHARRGAL